LVQSENDRQNLSTSHLRVAKRGAEDRTGTGEAAAGGLRDRNWCPRGFYLPLKGKVESAKEFLLLIKTTKKRFAAVRDAVLKLHSYDVPEIIALPIAAGSRAYVDWIEASVSAT